MFLLEDLLCIVYYILCIDDDDGSGAMEEILINQLKIVMEGVPGK